MGNGVLRVLHTADWHLGKTLGEQVRSDEHEAFLCWLIEQVKCHAVDLLVVAGDIFDSANPTHSATSQCYAFLDRLNNETDCHVVMVAGNHDSCSLLDSIARILNRLRVHVIGSMPQVSSDVLVCIPNADAPKIVVAALPFLRDRDVRIGRIGESADDIHRQLVAGIEQRYNEAAAAAMRNCPNLPIIATGHLTVAGSRTSESEREIHIGGLGAFSSDRFPTAFQYVALGHLHRPQPEDAGATVRYAGSPIALSFSEAEDVKEVRLLEFSQGKLTSQTPLFVPKYRALLCLTCHARELEQFLAQYQWPELPGGSYVDLVVTGAEGILIDADKAKQAVTRDDVTIIGIRNQCITASTSAASEHGTVDQAISFMRSRPELVFEKRLQELDDLPVEEQENLRREFSLIMELYHSDRNETVLAPGGEV